MDLLKNVKTSQMSVTIVESISLNSDFHPAYSFLSKFGFDENWLIRNVQKTVQIFDSKVEKNIYSFKIQISSFYFHFFKGPINIWKKCLFPKLPTKTNFYPFNLFRQIES